MEGKRKVLAIDDEEAILRLLERFFVSRGCSFRGVREAEEALSILEREPFDLVLLDDGLPKMMGLTAIPEIRKLSPVPIVMITGLDNEEMRADAKLLGARKVLVKPIDLDCLDDILKDLPASREL